MRTPDHITCLVRNLYAAQDATVRSRPRTTAQFIIVKGELQDYILSPYLFNLYTEYIMQNAWLDESQAGMNISWRNINKFRYADDTTLNGRKQRGTKEPLDEGERGE